jgi:hypothetical protein
VCVKYPSTCFNISPSPSLLLSGSSRGSSLALTVGFAESGDAEKRMMTQYKECPVIAPAEYQVDQTLGNIDRANLLAGFVIYEHPSGGDLDVFHRCPARPSCLLAR